MDEIFYSIDFPSFIIAALAGFCCSLTGSLLLFQKRSMMADTLTHSILPGLALAYIVTGTMSVLAMLSGAYITCLCAALIVHLIHRHTVLDNTIAMGIVLTSMFAFGIILLELFIDGRVHLDTQHALYGALELTYWSPPYTFETLPDQIVILTILAVILLLAYGTLYKYYKLMLFDEIYARITGLPIKMMNAALLIITVAVCVSCFDAVGAILVLALLICPPAAARLLTDKFLIYTCLSCLIGVFSGIMGYFMGAIFPLALGFENSISATGTIAIIAGIVLTLSVLFAPQYGYFSKRLGK